MSVTIEYNEWFSDKTVTVSNTKNQFSIGGTVNGIKVYPKTTIFLQSNYDSGWSSINGYINFSDRYEYLNNCVMFFAGVVNTNNKEVWAAKNSRLYANHAYNVIKYTYTNDGSWKEEIKKNGAVIWIVGGNAALPTFLEYFNGSSQGWLRTLSNEKLFAEKYILEMLTGVRRAMLEPTLREAGPSESNFYYDGSALYVLNYYLEQLFSTNFSNVENRKDYFTMTCEKPSDFDQGMCKVLKTRTLTPLGTWLANNNKTVLNTQQNKDIYDSIARLICSKSENTSSSLCNQWCSDSNTPESDRQKCKLQDVANRFCNANGYVTQYNLANDRDFLQSDTCYKDVSTFAENVSPPDVNLVYKKYCTLPIEGIKEPCRKLLSDLKNIANISPGQNFIYQVPQTFNIDKSSDSLNNLYLVYFFYYPVSQPKIAITNKGSVVTLANNTLVQKAVNRFADDSKVEIKTSSDKSSSSITLSKNGKYIVTSRVFSGNNEDFYSIKVYANYFNSELFAEYLSNDQLALGIQSYQDYAKAITDEFRQICFNNEEVYNKIFQKDLPAVMKDVLEPIAPCIDSDCRDTPGFVKNIVERINDCNRDIVLCSIDLDVGGNIAAGENITIQNNCGTSGQISCTDDSNCGLGRKCIDGFCRELCNLDSDCSTGFECSLTYEGKKYCKAKDNGGGDSGGTGGGTDDGTGGGTDDGTGGNDGSAEKPDGNIVDKVISIFNNLYKEYGIISYAIIPLIVILFIAVLYALLRKSE